MNINELDADLRSAFARAGAGIEVTDPTRARLCGRNYRPRVAHHGRITAAVVAAAAAAGVAVPVTVGVGSTATAPSATITLDSYRFTMPAGYHALHGRRACALAVGFHVPPAGHGVPRVPRARLLGDRHIKAVASADGGCIAMLLLSAYRLPPGTTDPYAFAGSRPVRVGRFPGLLYHVRSYERVQHGKMVPEKRGMFVLFVEMPTSGGKVRDLIVGSNRLSERQLVGIVRRGLSR